MMKLSILFLASALAMGVKMNGSDSTDNTDSKNAAEADLNLGAFSISLAVKDLKKSAEFYETLGFKKFGGDAKQNWLILQNSNRTTIGLFQGMFKENIMTFNPGWTSSAQGMKDFTDIREIQKIFKEANIALETEADESTTGPASITLLDPDGNRILLDQHL